MVITRKSETKFPDIVNISKSSLEMVETAFTVRLTAVSIVYIITIIFA